MVKIINPAYDIAFKYLMEDQDAATVLLSDLLQKQIIDLQFKPKEYLTKIKLPDGQEKSFSFYRLDFKAKVKTFDGKEKIILIEVQRAFIPTDVLRFRRYLGEQYSSKENFVDPEQPQQAIPLFSIYFLGYNLKDLPKIPILRIERCYKDFGDHSPVEAESEFVEALSHDMIVVQLPVLKQIKKPKTETENILQLFEPNPNTYYLWVDENEFSPKYKSILKRLKMGAANTKILEQMQFEDEIMLAFKIYEKQLQEERRKAQEERRRVMEANKRIMEERKRALAEKIRIVKNLRRRGMSIDEIAQITGFSAETVKKIIENNQA